MTIPLKRRLISLAEYHKMVDTGILGEDDPIELIKGEILYMSPTGSNHGAKVKLLNALFSKLLGEKSIISVQDPIVLRDSEPQPDICLLHLSDDFYKNSHPQSKDVFLVIEVAQSSISYDQEIKIPLYAGAEIPEYWIINLEANQIEVYRNPRNGDYSLRQILYSGDTFSPLAFPEVVLAVSDILA